MVAYDAGAPTTDSLEFGTGKGSKGISVPLEFVASDKGFEKVKGDISDLVKELLKTTDETKNVAKLIRRGGSIASFFDAATGSKLFKLSRVAMTLGKTGVAISTIMGTVHFLTQAVRDQREEWDRNINSIGKAHQEYEEYLKLFKDPKKVAIMEEYGLKIDSGYLNTLQQLNQLYPAFHRDEKVDEAAEHALLKSMIRVAGGMEAFAEKIESMTDSKIFNKSIDIVTKTNPTPFGDLIKFFGNLSDNIRGITEGGGMRPGETLELWKPKTLKQLQYVTNSPYISDKDRALVEEAYKQLEAENVKWFTDFSKSHFSTYSSTNAGIVDMIKGISTQLIGYLAQTDMAEESRDNTLADLLAQIEKHTNEISTFTTRIAPTGIWSQNVQGNIPYTSYKVKLPGLYHTDEPETPSAAQSQSQSLPSGSPESAGHVISEYTPPVVNINTVNANATLEVPSIQDILSALTPSIVMRAVAEINKELWGAVFGARSKFG